MLLSALGIFFVVDMHAGSPFGIFNSIFDYESFFMQMFVFISGYFFKEKNRFSHYPYHRLCIFKRRKPSSRL